MEAEAAAAAERQRALDDFLASIPPPAPPTTTQAAQQPASLAPGAGGGSPWPQIWEGEHSDAWWAAIAQCESGTTNGWRTGYFGLEGRPGISALSYEDQRAVARWIHSWAGDGAWACSPRAYAAVPGG